MTTPSKSHIGKCARMLRDCAISRSCYKKGEVFTIQKDLEGRIVGGEDGCRDYQNWELIEPMEYTLETVPVGSLVKSQNDYYRKVLNAIGEGESRILFLSEYSKDSQSKDLQRLDEFTNAFELRERDFTVVNSTPSRTLDDVLSSLPEGDKEIVRNAVK